MEVTVPAIVMGLTVWVIEVIKLAVPEAKKEVFKQFVPGIIILVAVLFNMIGAGIFGSGFTVDTMRAAAQEGIQFSIVASGLYGLGKAALGKS